MASKFSMKRRTHRSDDPCIIHTIHNLSCIFQMSALGLCCSIHGWKSYRRTLQCSYHCRLAIKSHRSERSHNALHCASGLFQSLRQTRFIRHQLERIRRECRSNCLIRSERTSRKSCRRVTGEKSWRFNSGSRFIVVGETLPLDFLAMLDCQYRTGGTGQRLKFRIRLVQCQLMPFASSMRWNILE